MQIIIIPKNTNSLADTPQQLSDSNRKHLKNHRHRTISGSNNTGLLRFAIENSPIDNVLLNGLSRKFSKNGNPSLFSNHNGNITCAIPQEWHTRFGKTPIRSQIRDFTSKPERLCSTGNQIITYSDNIPINWPRQSKAKSNGWTTFSNGRFITHFNNGLLEKLMANTQAQVLAVNAQPDLLAYNERVRLTTQNKIAGIYRHYSDSAETGATPTDWPHHLFIKSEVLNRILVDYALPSSFSIFKERCRCCELTLCSINVAGQVLDLETEEGFLSFCKTIIRNSRFINNNHMARLGEESHIRTEPAAACLSRSGICSGQDSNTIAKDCRLVGKVLLGENIHIRQNAVIVGPTIIGNNVIIEHGAVINSSIIGPNVLVQRNQLVQNSIIKTHAHLGEGRSQSGKGKTKHLTLSINNNSKQRCFTKFELNGQQHINGMYRNWPRFSYACCIKRIADCFTAIIMLILFAPLTPFLALAVKLTSSGPVFFKDKRQGLHGKAFYCLKFRTMTFGADKIQDKLRTVSQVDGPQFKMKDDPRLTSVGRFLRDTCIDEIPQFINVLLGQMSVVGPRPSPESENTLCPYWRDARLSVRPGITGLWQVCRTRQSGKDFQEWIHFDTEYVKNLTFRMDLWICWKTAKKLIKDFVGHF